MGLDLHAGNRIVSRQQQKRVHGGIVMSVRENKRRSDRGDRSHLSAGKAGVTLALEPEIRVVGLIRSRACEDVLQRLRRYCPDGRRVDCLPERLAKPPPSQTAPTISPPIRRSSSAD